jgi:hypothetical protein
MKSQLWLRLKHYHFEHLVPPHLSDHVLSCFGGPDAATRAFASKLGRKLGWTPRFARRAIDEYRKFVYLGVVADFGVTPSKVIDQVWHEHLLFTKAYGEFCRDVLGRPFEHYPELVATDEQTSVFQEQYERTLDLYEDEFNVAPPVDIWSTPKFAPGIARVRRAMPKKWSPATTASSSGDDAPLYTFFVGAPAVEGQTADAMPEFVGGGGFSGAGGGDSWADSLVDSVATSHADSTGDSSSGDGGSSGGDSGSSDGGGSGCSSGCGGGGCGGGGE